MARNANPGAAVEWVESGGGPLIAVPEAVLPFWAGADGDELSTDYDRACEVDGRIGFVPVGDTTALVLGDEPASTAFLTEHDTFVRWCAADSEDELLASIPAALAAAEWEADRAWDIPGRAPSTRPGRARRRTVPIICGWSWRRGGTRCGRRMWSRGRRRGWGLYSCGG